MKAELYFLSGKSRSIDLSISVLSYALLQDSFLTSWAKVMLYLLCEISRRATDNMFLTTYKIV